MADPEPKRAPAWLTWGWTAWVVVWAPIYCWWYGPLNFLWFCDIGNFVLVAALWRSSRLLFSWQALSLLVTQALWSLDCAARLLLGRHLIGGTEYMFDPSIPLGIRLMSLFHVALLPLLVWALWRFGYDRRALLLQFAANGVIMPLSYIVGPHRNINWSWGPFGLPQTTIAPGLYLIVAIVVYPLILGLPIHLAAVIVQSLRKRAA